MNDKHNILITGGSGFIGGHIVKLFSKKGNKISCLVRRNSDLSFINNLPVEFVFGDVTDYISLSEAIKGKSAVIHIAGMATDWGQESSFFKVNVDGTLNVMRAVRDHGVDQLIITGSVSSYGEENSNIVKDENSPNHSHYPYFMHKIFPSSMNHYRNSKNMATIKAIEYAKEYNMNLTILEPVWVYGENEFSSGFYEYIKAVKSGAFIMPGSKRNKLHVIYASDLANAYYLAFQKNLRGINKFIIGDETAINMDFIYSLFCKEAGKLKPFRVPKPLIYPLAFALELFGHVLKFRKPPLLTRSRVNMFYDNIEFNTEKAAHLLSFKAETQIETGIHNTVQWYKKHKYI